MKRIVIHTGDTEESLHKRIKIVRRGHIVATIASLLTTLEKDNG